MNALELAHSIVNALEERKGENILLLDLRAIAAFTDFFVLCTGTSDRMLDALAESALDKAREVHGLKGRKDGLSSAGWVAVDFGYVTLHIFAQETRDFYNLEELWKEGKVLLRLQ